MTARRRALQALPDTDTDPQDWRTPTAIDQFRPEHQFIGSLLWLGGDAAQPLLDLVPSEAIWDPQTRWAYELIRRVVDAGNTPTPPAVLAAGRRHAATEALDSATAPNSDRLAHLSLYLFDAYAQAIAPAAAARIYARDVLEEAYRRAFAAAGTRMQELAASDGIERDDLTRQFAAIADRLADLGRRIDAAAGPHR